MKFTDLGKNGLTKAQIAYTIRDRTIVFHRTRLRVVLLFMRRPSFQGVGAETQKGCALSLSWIGTAAC